MSRKKEYKAPDVSYEFDCHGRGYGSTHLAVNVKCHAYPQLTGKHHDMLDELRKTQPKIEDKLRERAWSDTVDTWWVWAHERADHYSVGRIFCEGRQGGWLILDEWSPSKVEEWLDEREDRCAHCDDYASEHVAGQCLFGSTEYTPTPKVPRGNKERLDEIAAFFAEIENSVAGAGENLQYNLEQLIEAERAEPVR